MSSAQDFKHEEAEVWCHSQALAALLSSPEASPEDLDSYLAALELPFRRGLAIEKDGVKYGWLAHTDYPHTQAEPAIWTAIALAEALSRPDLLTGERRLRLKQRFLYTQQVLATYRPTKFTGGWNMFPNQKEPSVESPYTTTLMLIAFLESGQAHLPWETSSNQADELVVSAANWLVKRYEPAGNPPGWRATNVAADRVIEGLTFQIYAALLRAHNEAGYTIPEAIAAQIAPLLERCVERPIDYPDMSEYTLHALRTHNGTDYMGRQGLTFYWYPWAVECAVRWLEFAEKEGQPAENVARVHRVLGHLVVDLGDYQRKKCDDGWVFAPSETLYCLSHIRPHKSDN
jgi:hypothetical protein